jgi:hypothetical protein
MDVVFHDFTGEKANSEVSLLFFFFHWPNLDGGNLCLPFLLTVRMRVNGDVRDILLGTFFSIKLSRYLYPRAQLYEYPDHFYS